MTLPPSFTSSLPGSPGGLPSSSTLLLQMLDHRVLESTSWIIFLPKSCLLPTSNPSTPPFGVHLLTANPHHEVVVHVQPGQPNFLSRCIFYGTSHCQALAPRPVLIGSTSYPSLGLRTGVGHICSSWSGCSPSFFHHVFSTLAQGLPLALGSPAMQGPQDPH